MGERRGGAGGSPVVVQGGAEGCAGGAEGAVLRRRGEAQASSPPAPEKAASDGGSSPLRSKLQATGAWMPDVQFSSMFEHMFQRQRLVDLRRRALTLIDVVAERQDNGPLKKTQLLLPLVLAIAYWYFLLPAFRDKGLLRWYSTDDQPSRAGGPWAEVSWQCGAAITLTYLVGVLLGVQVMRGRAPIEKHVFECMLIYNLAMVLLNASLAFSLVREAWRLGFPHPWGNGLDTSSGGHGLGMLIWFQYHCRQLELVDTVFVILRKKFDRMTFLHVYLRLVHMWGWFFACRYACGGDSYFPAAANSACQVVVYLYYVMSMIHDKGMPLMRKARVTEVQVLQFVICATHATYVLAFGHLPRAVAAVSLAVMASGLFFYVEWGGGQPTFAPRVDFTKEMSMFGHMFENKQRLVDLRRRALTLIDVVSERQLNGPLRPHRLVAAFGVSLVYWYFVLPALRDWGTNHWRRAKVQYVRPGGPWSEVNLSVAVLVTVVYLFIVYAGVRVMERRPPVQKRVFEYMFIYNATQVLLNLSLSFNLWREAYRLGFERPWGNGLDAGEAGHRLGMLLWFQYHCRQLELLDTIFVILRKKFHHMSLLHIFLRLTHMWGWFVVCRFACGGDSYFPAAVNCTCQVIVYLYYTMSMLHEQGAPIVRKAHVGEVQVAQFVLCAVHSCYVLYSGNLPRGVATLSLLVMCASLVLYSDFTGELSKLTAPEARESDAGRLTFRFDSSGWFYCYHFGVAHWLQEHILPEGLNSEDAASDKYPKDLAFAGSSGGALVAAALATGIDIRDLFEFVMEQHGPCRRNPYRMFQAVEDAMNKFLPKNCAKSMSGRVRVLLTRISTKWPFVTADVVDQYADWQESFHALRATCHVPGMNIMPYQFSGRSYFDGLVWSSLLVPWSGDENDLVVKVSATSTPLTDIRAPVCPTWWIVVPPSIDTLRGMFWTGYRDAAIWFSEQPNQGGLCSCRATNGRGRRSGGGAPANGSAAGGASPGEGSPWEERSSVDHLSRSRLAKYQMAQRFLLKPPPAPGQALTPELDPVTGENVQELMRAYRQSIERNFKTAGATALGTLSAAFVAWLALRAGGS